MLKIALLGPYLSKNWASMGRTQHEVQTDHKLSRTFYFIKNKEL